MVSSRKRRWKTTDTVDQNLKIVSLLQISFRKGAAGSKAVWPNDIFTCTSTVSNYVKSRFVPEAIGNAKFSLTGHDKLSGHGICSRLLDGIANELFPSTSEFFWPKIQEVVSARGLTQTLKNVLQGEEQFPPTSWPLQHAICSVLCPGFA